MLRSSLVAAVLLSLLSVSLVSAYSNYVVNTDFELTTMSPWSVSPSSAASFVFVCNYSSYTHNQSLAIGQSFAGTSITSLSSMTALTVQQSLTVPSSTAFTLGFAIAAPINYGLQMTTTRYAYDSGAAVICNVTTINALTALGLVTEYTPYTCSIPAVTGTGSHTLAIQFAFASAYGFFFLDNVTLWG